MKIAFLLLPRYTLSAFACAIEPLRIANRVKHEQAYSWTTVGIDREVTASCGLASRTEFTITDAIAVDLLFVCGGVCIEEIDSEPLNHYLQDVVKKKAVLGSLCSGAYILARAGLLDGYRAAIHWENKAAIEQDFPEVRVVSEIFVSDRDRITCTGGTAPMDMMLNMIRHMHGADITAEISATLIYEHIRSTHDIQREPLHHRISDGQPKLKEAVSLMASNLEELISLDELAHHVGLSRRQLERLFKKHLGYVPTRYYMMLRLSKARQMLIRTNRSIVEIAMACGFISAPHFSKCFRSTYGYSPSNERNQHRDRQPLPINPPAEQH